MANLIEVTDTTKIKPLDGARIRRYTAGATVTAGYPVYLDSSGNIRIASGSTAAANRVIGVALRTLTTGDRGDVVVKGPVLCLAGTATPGSMLLTLNSAGGMDHTGGTKKTVIGVAESSTVLFVRPRMSDLS